MKHKWFNFLQIIIIVIFLLGSSNLQMVFAQDEAPVVDDSETVVEEPSTEGVVEETQAPDPEVTEAPVEVTPTEVVTEEPTEFPPTEVVTEVPEETEVPVESSAIGEPTAEPTEEPAPEEVIADVVETLDEENLTLADESGEALDMASQETADAITNGDPWFEVGGIKYQFLQTGGVCDAGVAYCYVGSNPIQTALDYIVTNTITIDSSTIHVEAGTYNESITIADASVFDGLILLGDPGDLTVAGASTSNAPVLDGVSDTGVGITIHKDGVSIIGFIIKNYGTAILIENASGNQDINILNNTITDNVLGLVQGAVTTGKPGLEVHYNAFVDNDSYDIVNATGGNIQWIDANNNYWGCATGPYVEVGGQYYSITDSHLNNPIASPDPACAVLHGDESHLTPYPYKIDIAAILGSMEKPVVTVTAPSPTINYGDPIPTLDPTYSGFLYGETAPATPAICVVTPASPTNVGSYPVTCSGAADPNYTFVYVPGTLTINPVEVTVTAPSPTINYGDPIPTLTPTYSGLMYGQTAPATPATCVVTPASPTNVGTYPVTCSGAADQNYTFVYVPGTLTINPVEVTVTAPSPTINYGDAIPALTPTYSGLKYGETAPDTLATCVVTPASPTDVGSYPVTCSGAADPNYTFVYVPGTLTINPVLVTVTAPSHTIGLGDPIPTLIPSYSGLMYGETSPDTPATCVVTPANPTAVGVYPITCSGAADPNYTFAYVPGTLTIGAAVVTVTAPSPTINYGDPIPTLTPTYSGFLYGETAPATPATCVVTPASPTNVGTYPVTCSGAVDSNYSFVYVPGTLTINPVRVIVTAPSPTINYGDPIPTLTPSYAGLMYGQTAPATPATCVVTPASPTDVGSYPVTCSGAADPNYTFTYVPGTLTINPVPVTVTAPSPTISYGDPIPTIDPTYAGFMYGETSPDTPATCVVTPDSPTDVGTYPVTCSGAADPNYTFAYVPGTLTINPVPLVITASSGTMVTGGVVPTITPSYAGFIAGDTAPAVLPVCSTTATSASPVGTYPSSCSGALDPNYLISYVPGVVTVTAIIIPPPPPPPIPVTGGPGPGLLIPVTGGNLIVSGLGHSCMPYGDGQAICWGLNASGQLGDGTTVNRNVAGYVENLTGVLSLTAGSKHTCALTTDNEVWCWGENSYGQLGNDSTTDSSLPVLVTGLPADVLSLSAGEMFTCAQLTNNEVWCWGKNNFGQLNDGSTEYQTKPVKADLGTNLAQISGGMNSVFVGDVLGDILKWANQQSNAVQDVSNTLSISANRWSGSGCSISFDGSILCWGNDLVSSLVENGLPALEVGTGADHGCVVNDDETASCWGVNTYGELGNGSNLDSTIGVLVSNLTKVHTLGVGANHTCALVGTNNLPMCWGENKYGQLGNGTNIDSNVPVSVILP